MSLTYNKMILSSIIDVARRMFASIRMAEFSIIWLLAIANTSCERRDLWVLADEYRQVELITDWSGAEERPAGMTAWFINNDGSGRYRNFKSIDVDHMWLGLPRGIHTGLVFDYSPEEYAHLDFVNMDDPIHAEARAAMAEVQPELTDRNTVLFGDESLHTDDQSDYERDMDTGLFLVADKPDSLHLDVLKDVEVVTGTDYDYVLWEESEDYKESLVTQTLYAHPVPILWKLRVVVNIKGIQYMRSVRASVAGLSGGYVMPLGEPSARQCLHELDEWKAAATSVNTGRITTIISTFGLPKDITGTGTLASAGNESSVTRGEEQEYHEYIDRLRLNLSFLLADDETVKDYHYDIDLSHYLTIYEEERLLYIEIPLEEGPDLPYTKIKDGANFDVEVDPWQDGGMTEIDM
ncbi:MAG: DUF5119 domain-containing protein [Bacteroidaceae bacterium]|nr:DUF5119 domain-containing protein [Bacteroidaceae bacterium]